MNVRQRVLARLSATAAVTLLLWLAWRQVPSRRGALLKGSAAEPVKSPVLPLSLGQLRSEPGPPGYLGLNDPRWHEWDEKERANPSFQWQTPLNFYGKVIDENGLPVSGAIAELTWTDASDEGTSKADTTSDAEGNFSLLDRHGKFLVVDLKKAGYYTEHRRNRFDFDYSAFWDRRYHQADPQKPVVFHVRKKQPGEALVEGEFMANLPQNGTPVRFDLLNAGRLSPRGQIEIGAVTSQGPPSPDRFDWNATVRVVGGGVHEFDLEFPFAAPEAGYEPRAESS